MAIPRLGFTRPRPPAELRSRDEYGTFARARDVEQWILDAFVKPGAPFYDADHCHLLEATVGVLWSNIPVSRRGIPIAGTASMVRPHPALSAYDKQVQLWFLRQFFGLERLNFLITLDAPYAAECEDVDFCAGVKHELVHCDQKRDENNERVFTGQDFRPVFCIRGHDVEEQISVVRDFGLVGRNVKEFVKAATGRPRIAQAKIAWACGNCLAKAA